MPLLSPLALGQSGFVWQDKQGNTRMFWRYPPLCAVHDEIDGTFVMPRWASDPPGFARIQALPFFYLGLVPIAEEPQCVRGHIRAVVYFPSRWRRRERPINCGEVAQQQFIRDEMHSAWLLT